VHTHSKEEVAAALHIRVIFDCKERFCSLHPSSDDRILINNIMLLFICHLFCPINLLNNARYALPNLSGTEICSYTSVILIFGYTL
jgi:hypothetical protein